jgi:type IV fimbrial biogenesis protein FimT
MKKSNGFTLIELLVVIAIAAILAALAVPSFGRLIESTSLSSNVNTFLADIRFARNEAVKRGTLVVMCSSANPEAATPNCSGSQNWERGWIIFEDWNNNGLHSNDEPLLRQQGSVASSGVISTNPVRPRVHFVATGRARSPSDATMITFYSPTGLANNVNSLQRVICINMSGRARIVGDGSTSCTTTGDN